MIKILQIRNIAGVSLLGFVMMFAAIAPSMTSTSTGHEARIFCQTFLGAGWVGIGVVGDLTLVKCFDLNDPCFDEGVPVKSDGPTTCVFLIFAQNFTGQNVILKDAIPAEWNAEIGPFSASFNCLDNLEQANKNKKADRSAT